MTFYVDFMDAAVAGSPVFVAHNLLSCTVCFMNFK